MEKLYIDRGTRLLFKLTFKMVYQNNLPNKFFQSGVNLPVEKPELKKTSIT